MSIEKDALAKYLLSKIELNDSQMNNLRDRVDVIERFLKKSSMGSHIKDKVIPQGSYARRTIIKPIEGLEFDADFLLPLEETPGLSPKKYLDAVYNAFAKDGTYKDKIRKTNRSVEIKYADEFHIDVVPYVRPSNRANYIIDYEENKKTIHNPSRYNKEFIQANKDSNGLFIKSVRIIKRMRDNAGLETKSFILSTLLLDAAKIINKNPPISLAEYLLKLIKCLNSYLKRKPGQFRIDDRESGDLYSRWDKSDLAKFRKEINSWEDLIDKAIKANPSHSESAWKKVLPDFVSSRKPSVPSSIVEKIASLKPNWAEYYKYEEYFHEKHPDFLLNIDNNFSFEVEEWGNAAKNPIVISAKGQVLKFKVKHSNSFVSSSGYDIYWKVRNSGKLTLNLKPVRGKIFPLKSFEHTENAEFKGRHWIEVWVVKDKEIKAYFSHVMDFI